MSSRLSNEDRNLRNVKEYLRAFGSGDADVMASHLAENAVFDIPGPKYSAYSKRIRGKSNIREFYVRRQETREKFIKSTSVQPRFITGKNAVIAEWTVKGLTREGEKFESRGTNHFVLDKEGKITRVSIFINAPLSSDVKSLAEKRLMVSDQGQLALMAWSVV
jgi:ketosteroid isomerase-like protein